MTANGAADAAQYTPSATRKDLQLGRRFFHLVNGVSVATAYALLFTHQQVVHIFGTVACIVYIVDRVRIAYPEVLVRHAPWVNRTLLRAEEHVLESSMIPFVIAVLLTMLTVPKLAALIAIYTLAIADPLAAVVGIRFGRHRILPNRSLEGSLAFFVATVAIAAGVLRWGTEVAWTPLFEAAIAIGAVATLFELLPLRIDDNLTIPIFVGFATWSAATLLAIPLR
jgi:dolichol kinase